MKTITFTSQMIEDLADLKKNHPHPHVRKKAEALLLKSQGFPHYQICKAVGICAETLCTYLDQYIDGGLERIKQIHFHRQTSDLEIYADVIRAHVDDNAPRTIKQTGYLIEQLTGVKRSTTQVRAFLLRHGFKRNRVIPFPSKANPEKQDVFLKGDAGPVNPRCAD